MLNQRKIGYYARILATFMAMLLLLSGSWTVSAGKKEVPVASPQKGYALAERFCTTCHLVGDNAGATVPAGVPTFRGIANKPGQTGQHIMDVLIKPHPPMPDIQLTREEMLHIVSYLDTLRTDKSGTPLLQQDESSPKPEYPDHS